MAWCCEPNTLAAISPAPYKLFFLYILYCAQLVLISILRYGVCCILSPQIINACKFEHLIPVEINPPKHTHTHTHTHYYTGRLLAPGLVQHRGFSPVKLYHENLCHRRDTQHAPPSPPRTRWLGAPLVPVSTEHCTVPWLMSWLTLKLNRSSGVASLDVLHDYHPLKCLPWLTGGKTLYHSKVRIGSVFGEKKHHLFTMFDIWSCVVLLKIVL